MRIVVLVRHIRLNAILAMYFKNKDRVTEWWRNFPYSEEWEIIHEGERERSGHRYELKYYKFSEEGKMLANYIFCFSKKEALTLREKINNKNPNYLTSIKKLY